jgi:hypothetical protein
MEVDQAAVQCVVEAVVHRVVPLSYLFDLPYITYPQAAKQAAKTAVYPGFIGGDPYPGKLFNFDYTQDRRQVMTYKKEEGKTNARTIKLSDTIIKQLNPDTVFLFPARAIFQGLPLRLPYMPDNSAQLLLDPPGQHRPAFQSDK